MAIKLLSEGVAAWAAVVLSAGGGLYVSAHNSGAQTAQVQELQAKVAKHDEQLTSIQQQNARIDQKLDDVVGTVHDIQDHIHGDHSGH